MEYTRTCQNCLWADQCESDHACDDYSPADQDGPSLTFYESILRENASLYRLLEADYADHDMEVDE